MYAGSIAEPRAAGQFGDIIGGQKTAENPFRRFWELGYRHLVPVIPPGAPISERSSLHRRIAAGDDARGKTPGLRWGDGTWSGFDWVQHEMVEGDLERWAAMGAGVGIRTGFDGLVLIDADAPNPDHAAAIKSAVAEHFGALPERIGRAPKAGYLVRVLDQPPVYRRVEFGERDEKGRLRDRVEVLTAGRFFVAHGIHPVTLKPYRWPQDVPRLDDVPVVKDAQLAGFLEALRGVLPKASGIQQEGQGAGSLVNQQALRGDPGIVERAVRATPNTSDQFPTRESYRDYGYAIKAALPDAPDLAFELWTDWCARWDEGENDPAVVDGDWRRMKPPFRRGAGWLYELAERYSGGAFTAASAWFEPIVDVDDPFAAPAQSVTADPRFRFLTLDEASEQALAAGASPLIRGLLDQGAMSVLYGDSNVGKTFVAVDMALHVAAGLSYGGMATAGVPVAYIAAEGGSGVLRRLLAAREKYGLSQATAPFFVLPAAVNLRQEDADLPGLVAAIRGLPERPGLIVIDTLSRAMAGGDENSSVDMGALVKNLDTLRSEFSAHLMVVHHTGKDRAKGARGHSLLRAATDTEIEVEDGVISVTKQRDLDREWSSGFVLEPRVIGLDAAGLSVRSCTVRLTDAPGTAAADPIKDVREKNHREKMAIGAVLAKVLYGRRSLRLKAEIDDILAHLRDAGVTNTKTRHHAIAAITAALAGDGAIVDYAGHWIHLRVEKEGPGKTAAWIVTSEPAFCGTPAQPLPTLPTLPTESVFG